MAARKKAPGKRRAKGETPRQTPNRDKQNANLRPPWTAETHPRGGRPKGGLGLKATIKKALEGVEREGEKPTAERIAGLIRRKCLRSPEFALKAADYVDPRTNVLEGSLDLGESLEDRVLDTLDRLAAVEVASEEGAPRAPRNGAGGDAQHDPTRPRNGGA